MELRPEEEQAQRLAEASLAGGDPTGWFERLYAAAQRSGVQVPWDRGAPHFLLVEWAQAGGVSGAGRRALVVGCGLGNDSEYVAGLGFSTVAFDISATAIRETRRRFPDSGVEYVAANLLSPPAEWRRAFDFVVESLTVQALPDAVRPEAISRVAEMVAGGGTLLVIANGREDGGPVQGPPWPLVRAEVEAFGGGGLEPVRIERVADASEPSVFRWRAEFRR